MADDEKAEAGAASTETGNADIVTLLREIRNTQREASEREARFLWLLIPIFALLCVQAVLLLLLH